MSARSDAFPIRAVIEGFYGVFYTHPQRLDLLRFLGDHDYNLYIYGPKNDRQHRARWREPYPESLKTEFAETVRTGREHGVEFCYSLAPGVNITYSSPADLQHIVTKFEAFHRLGVRTFALLLDDIRRTFSDPADRDSFGSLAGAQAQLCNAVLEHLTALDSDCRLLMCPTEYHGLPPFSQELEVLGRELDPRIEVFYTGGDVCSHTIGREEVEAFALAVDRKPLIWDNYPVNDLAMHRELHIGPIEGRAADLAGAVAGFAVNPMNQVEASKVPLATFAEYFADPDDYDPWRSWHRAIELVAGENATAMEAVGLTSLRSCLHRYDPEPLATLVTAAVAAFEARRPYDPAVRELHDYLAKLDEAAYELRYRNPNLALRFELLPWLEQLEQWTFLGRWSIEALETALTSGPEAVEGSLLRRIGEYLGLTEEHPKRIAGTVLRPLALLALDRAAAEVA